MIGKSVRLGAVVSALLLMAAPTMPAKAQAPQPGLKICEDCIRRTEAMLAAPQMRGRACGTDDEHDAARKLVELFKAAGVQGAAADGGYIQSAPFTPRGQTEQKLTLNVVGVLHGAAPDADKQAILLTAHYDHLGVRNGQLYPGANDDASGSSAVVEFARLLGAGAKPKRTVEFALFGCEEAGGYGARYYTDHPPVPLGDIAANLEFEMIGALDPAHPKTLMLTGWERSNLGPALQARGARIGPDPYPEQNYFRRSDNYQLALKGVVAQTISAWPLTPTYHQPSDDLAHLDMPFMLEVIQSMAEPVHWLVNSDFRPQWNPGMQPTPVAPAPNPNRATP